MYATKLMMNQGKIYNYVEDDSLVYKGENVKTNNGTNLVTVKDVTTGVRAFTFCGTLPNVTGYLFHIFNFRLALNRSASVVRLYNSQAGSPIISYNEPLSDIQPYVVAMVEFADSTNQKITLKKMSDDTVVTKTGKYNGTETDCIFKPMQNFGETIDLILVYDRVLTDEELEQNYQAFLQRHR